MVDGRRACLSKLMFLDDLFRSRYEKSTNDLYTFLFSFCENILLTGFFQKNGSNFYYGSKVKFFLRTCCHDKDNISHSRKRKKKLGEQQQT